MSEEINRIDIEVQKYLKPNQYCLLDYLLYRSNLDGWNFYISNIVDNTALTTGTTHRTLVKLVKLGWASQNSENHYVFNRDVFLAWMNSKLEQPVPKRNDNRSKMEPVVPKWNGERSTVECTNRKEQIGITKSTQSGVDLFQKEMPAAIEINSGISASEALPVAISKKTTDSVGQTTATKSAASAAPAPVKKYSPEYLRQMAVEQNRNMRLYGSPFGRR